MRRAGLILTLTLGSLVAPVTADAQQAREGPRIGMLCLGSCSTLPNAVRDADRAFLQGLREAGYSLGENAWLDTGGVGATVDRLPALVAGLIRRKADVILAFDSASTEAAKRATTTIPIVMVGAADAVELGLILSLARPGGNVTGVTVPSGQLAAKQLELLKEADPRLSRVAVLWDRSLPQARPQLSRIEVAVRPLRVEIQSVEVRGPWDYASAFSAIIERGANGLLVQGIFASPSRRSEIVLFALERRLPTVASGKDFARAGGLLAYGPDPSALYRRAAAFAGKILKGARPDDLPVEEPVRYELVMNLPTAKALGLTIPQSLLIRADQVIE